MEVMDGLFKVGDWVTVDGGFVQGFTGYIIKCDFVDDRCFVNLTSTENGDAINSGRWIDLDRLVPAKKFEEEDLFTLIDMALAMKDAEWFNELTSQMQNVNF